MSNESKTEMGRYLKSDVEGMYWLMEDPVCRSQDLEVEMVEGKHESIFDALAVIMKRRKSR